VGRLRPIDASATFPPTTASAGAARRFLRETLTRWDADVFEDHGSLAVTELVTNAVLHARTAVDVSISLDGTRLRVEVRDGNPVLPAQKHYGAQAGTGRGLHIVAGLATGWGADPNPDGGKTVWFELDGAHAAESVMLLDADLLVDLDDIAALGAPPPDTPSERRPAPGDDQGLGGGPGTGPVARLFAAITRS
jgi:hypothetical protein